ncbi:hypothetical protein [Pseudomonas putida]|uniref:Uncharacterized protein n=1 Tax=Pseudomonas putida (strain ATCC 700007 / DSM 6899 / JCM 31910 / BCRC 17059 / LMG 24140 / F1) TaxID=351746 RepID=A5W5W6_PSEP1
MFIVTRRATVLVPSGTVERPDLKHLYILLNDPSGKDKLVLMVSISTVHPEKYHDPTCILEPGDHSFIRSKSYVMYSMARIESVKTLENGVAQNLLIPKEPMAAEVFTRICQGVLDSKRTPIELKRFFEPIWKKI